MVAYDVMPVLPAVKAHLIVNCILAFVAYVVVGLRIFSRLYIMGSKIGWDDIAILLAVPQGLGMLIISGMYSQLGIGYPLAEAATNVPMILRLLVCYELIFATSAFTIKVSVLLFYLRVFVTPVMKLATKITLAFVITWTVGNILQVFLICRPFAAAYDTNIEGTCGSQVASFISIGCFNVVTDVIILSLPIPTVWSLKASTKVKIMLTAVMLVGLLVSVVAIARIVSLTTVKLATNLTGTMVYADFLSAVEPNLAILCVSLPMLRSLKSRVMTRSRYGQSSTSEGRLDKGYGKDSRHVRLGDGVVGESFAMDTVVKGGSSRGNDGLESPEGSQTELTPSGPPTRRPKQGIVVKTQVETHWTVADDQSD